MLEEAERNEASRKARRQASRAAQERAQAALNAEIEEPLVPSLPKHTLEGIAAKRPKPKPELDPPVPGGIHP